MASIKGKVLLIGAEDEENLALRYLAAVLKADGHEVMISPCSDHSQIQGVLKDVRRFKPQLIGVSMAFQSMANLYFELIREVKRLRPGAHITVGGHFPTFEFRKILQTNDSIDSVVRFEGETPILRLMDALLRRKGYSSVPNMVYRGEGGIVENPCINRFQELDGLPYPVRSRKPQERLGERFATLVFSRGCFHSSCLYCCIGAFHSKKVGQKFALRSPGNIAKEIAELYHRRKVRLFQFHDDNFMLPSKDDTLQRFRELKVALEKEGVDLKRIGFLIKARPDSIDDRIAGALNELGVIGVFLGVENACDSGLKSLIRGSAAEDIGKALKALSRYPMAITFNLLIFHPDANLDEINQNIYFIKNHLGYALDFGRAEIVAGSPLERLVVNEKLLQGSWPNWDYRIKDAAVERLFRLNQSTFRRSRSHYAQMVHSLIALAYQAYLINRLYPGEISDRLLARANALIRASNGFILKQVLEIYRLSGLERAGQEMVEREFHIIDDGSSKLMRRIGRLTSSMSRLQILEKEFRRFGIKESAQRYGFISKAFGLD